MRSLKLLFVYLGIVVAAGCKHPTSPKVQKSTALVSDTSFSKFIPVDSGNKMIQSYLYSINSDGNDSALRSIIFNAAELRSYLQDQSVEHIKLIFAHTLDFINAGNGNHFAGYNSGKLTLVIAAYDNQGNYVLHNGSQVLERGMPCPANCPSGTAGNPLIY